LVERPRLEIVASEARENFTQHRVRVEWARGQMGDGWLLVPGGQGPFPAMLVPFYEPETSIGMGTSRLRAFALDLTRRGFETLSIGSPGGDARRPESGNAQWQPLSFLAYVAANCHTALAQRSEVDPRRIGVIGHSYGGKWALFAAALHEKFACCVASDPGIVWDEKRPNVNYWEPWYLGQDAQATRRPGLITAENPRTGAYRALVEGGHDLQEIHALLAPRPFLVSGGAEDPPERWRALNHLVAVNAMLGFSNRVALTSRPKHEPTPESNEQMYEFVERFLKRADGNAGGF
jgi:pimeloyl-ACP methyl ester carboxylesterase